jgi:hypothetical protein
MRSVCHPSASPPPLGLSQYRLAKGLSVPPRRINEIVRPEEPGQAKSGVGRHRTPSDHSTTSSPSSFAVAYSIK